jgi:hypothetical protein
LKKNTPRLLVILLITAFSRKASSQASRTISSEVLKDLTAGAWAGILMISFIFFQSNGLPGKLIFLIDEKVYSHITNEHLTIKEWPFDQPFYLILKLAIGGGWGGKMGVDDSIFPAVLEIDYVRVFKRK